MQTDIFYASQYDTVSSIKDKIKHHETSRICLVLPTRHLLFDASQLNVLRDYCAGLGLELAIVTREPHSLILAKHLKIQQFPSIRRARKTSWYFYDDFLDEDEDETKNNEHEKKDLVALKARINAVNAEPKEYPRVRWILLSSVAIAFFALFVYLVPSATIFLSPKTQLQEMIVPMYTESGELGLGGMVNVLETTISVSTENQIQTTGEIKIPKSTAMGKVEFANLTNIVVSIPEGTELFAIVNDEQILVETSVAATLPAEVGSVVDVNVQASNPGEKGNLSANQIITIVGDLSFYATVTNSQSLRGGADETTKAPAKDDFTALRNQTLTKLETLASEKFQATAMDGFEIIDLTLIESEENFTPPSQSAADELSLEMGASFLVSYISYIELTSAFNMAFDAQMSEEYMPLVGSFYYEKNESEEDSEFRVNRVIVQKFNEFVLAEQVAGLSKSNAVSILENTLGVEVMPEIVFKPAFLNAVDFYKLPFFSYRIYIKVR